MLRIAVRLGSKIRSSGSFDTYPTATILSTLFSFILKKMYNYHFVFINVVRVNIKLVNNRKIEEKKERITLKE